MSLPNLSGEARLIEDPELRFTSVGKAVAKIRLAFNSRKKVNGEWIDGDTLFLEWEAESANTRVRDGIDTFVFRDGLIRLQTVRYTLEKK